MSTSIGQTLSIVGDWYNDPTTTDERAKLLSKLAVLELCGWLEGLFDEVIVEIDAATIADAKWVANVVIKRANGFDYIRHFRPMLTQLLGEVLLRKVEERIDLASPGDLERLRSTLDILWKTRCDFAHTDLVNSIATQKKFDAPSVSLSQQRALAQLIDTYRSHLQEEIKRLA